MQQSSNSQTTQLSYPPCFRPNTTHQSSNDNNLPNTENNPKQEQDPLPTIDLDRINLDTLEEACTDWGIFRLVNHGIPLTLLSKLYEHVVKVFEIGFETKESMFGEICKDVMSYFWGTPALTPTGDALYKDQGKVKYNWVEGLDFALSQPSGVNLDQYPLIRDTRILLEEYGAHQARIAESIFGAISQNLKLSEEKDYLSPSTAHLRVYRYPRCFVDKEPKVWGMEVHTDSSVVTILNQYEVGGLQILSEKDNEWIYAKPVPNTLLVHLGDMMQAISNDKYKSVKHRVMLNRESERISLGYFVFPGNDCVIQSSNYKPFTYSDFRAQVQHDVKTLGFKVGLSRFRLNENS